MFTRDPNSHPRPLPAPAPATSTSESRPATVRHTHFSTVFMFIKELAFIIKLVLLPQ